MKIAFVLGTRPQIIKSALFIYLANSDGEIDFTLIHTGQHYDYEMSKIFFEELNLPEPTVNLGVGSGSHAWQTATIMMRLEKILTEIKPDLVVVPGDTNSTLAGALTTVKLGIPLAHIEAGARSYDMRMPEEVNRRLTDHCSKLLFTPTRNCTLNLLKEGIGRDGIFEVGDTMYDVLLYQLPKIGNSVVLKEFGLKSKSYALLTVHRQENVDDINNLTNIVEAIVNLKSLIIVFPVHPRTQRKLQRTGFIEKLKREKHVKLIKPVGYLESLTLIKNAKLILTDSGGIQKEAFWLKTPCITLRENTEWIETVKLEANRLTGVKPQNIIKAVKEVMKNEDSIKEKLKNLPNPFGDGKASEKILDIIKNFLQNKKNKMFSRQ